MAGAKGIVNTFKLQDRLSTNRFPNANGTSLTNPALRKIGRAEARTNDCTGRIQKQWHHSLKANSRRISQFFGGDRIQSNKALQLLAPCFRSNGRSTARDGLRINCENGGDALLADGEGRGVLGAIFEQASHMNISGDSDFVREVATLALPAVLAQAVEPIAQLMDTAYVGRIGSVELAAVGVAVSIFNLISKLFNTPLVNVTTSFVAEDAASAYMQTPFEDTTSSEVPRQGVKDDRAFFQSGSIDGSQLTAKKQAVPSVSSALFLASLLAVVEAAILALGVGPILTVMGVPMGSPMRLPAANYLALRALGAPANVISLAVQGIFRGFKDTQTPLYATVMGNICNIVLAPILIFMCGFGISGAAVATVASQYFMALLLLWKLNEQVVLVPPNGNVLRIDRFAKSGGFLLGRTIAVIFTVTLATSMAARQGATFMAGHQILMQIWLATSLLSDALALAGQAMIATALAKGDFKRVEVIAFGVIQMGLRFGLLLALVLSIGLRPIMTFFTADSSVLHVLAQGTLFVAGTQPLNALAFVFDGVHYGVSDFEYAAYSMMVVGLLSSICLLVAPSFLGPRGVWLGLTLLMTLRVAAGLLRLGTATGPWQFLRK